MTNIAVQTNAPEIVCSDTLGHVVRNIIELSRAYDTVILLYEDDFSEKIQAAWAERDRLNVRTKKIGEIYTGIEIHSFGMSEFPPGTVLEISLREANSDANRQNLQRTLYRSILNELVLISVKIFLDGRGSLLLQ
jgi:hypothetical protein